jgi:hypothetical protein
MDGTWTSQGSNFDADPLFVDPAADNYHIRAGSPCSGTGIKTAPEFPPRDIEGRVRARADVGAYAVPTAPLAALLPILLE